ncbi:MAG: hypothetical protein ACI8PZ_005894 [Myxococcota bacterium]|jgi:hypothetical protein
MRIDSESLIAHPRDAVYQAYRDRLPEIAAYIPDIKQIIIHSRAESAAGVDLHNEWVADSEIPAVAKSLIKPEHLRWDDFAKWNDAGSYVDWTIKTRVFTDSVTCSGRNTFLEDGAGRTRVKLTGNLTIALKDIRGVPSFLAKRMAPQIEAFIVKLITPNLEQVNRSIGTFLDAQS